jgi:hypothetical protein
MENIKEKRPRKPAQPIKVASNTKSSPKGESGSDSPSGIDKDKYLTHGVSGLLDFYRGEIGKWR